MERNTETKMTDRKLLGYTERPEGFYPLYAAGKGYIVTQAFIHCKYCNSAISPCMGPRSDALCIPCYEREPDDRILDY